MARSVTPIIFRLADVGIERIIAELVDNSLDEGSDEINIRFFESNKREDDVGIAVLDNGNGFETPEDLFNAMEIQVKDNPKGVDEIGKYHIGMKLAPLSRYQDLYLVSIIEGKTWVCRAFNSDRTGKPFDMDDPKHENPTKPFLYNRNDKSIPNTVHAQLAGLKSERGKGDFGIPKSCKWATCVIAVRKWRDLLDDGFSALDCMLDENRYPKHLAQFLGMTYQRYFEENPELIMKVGENQKVEPYDPFWTQFTPSRIEEIARELEVEKSRGRLSQKELKKADDKIKAANALKKFGTFQGSTYVSQKFKGLEITPYVMPVNDAKSLIRKNLGDDWGSTTKVLPRTISKSGSNLMKQQKNGISGFFFYRGKRLISFGQFFDLNVIDNSANPIRIKVTFSGTELEEHMEVHPNKHKMDTISKSAWAEVLNGLSLLSGSSDYATPFNQNVPFFKIGETALPSKKKGAKESLWKKFEPTESSHYPNILARNDTDFLKYSKCQSSGGCGFIHEVKDTCPNWMCDTCNEKGKGCQPGSCTHECSHCNKVGLHSDQHCPKLCKKCGIDHRDKLCPKACEECKKEPCKCPCKVCGQSKPCKGCCANCKKKLDDCECDQGESAIKGSGNKQTAIMWKKNKTKNIEIVKELMESMGLTIDDLK
tara:strand:+ start:18 stop:1973 length:1956 start_codon:yes stop_codon:yes gene_type:complete